MQQSPRRAARLKSSQQHIGPRIGQQSLEIVDDTPALTTLELRARARDALLNDALAVEEELDEQQPAEDLLALEGMDEETAFALASHGVRTAEDLSDLGADEVVDFGIEGMDGVHAVALILAARAEEIARLERGA